MNVVQARPRNWTPHIILFSIVLHVVVLYYIAMSFQIVPAPQQIIDATPITMKRFEPPPPVVEEPTERIQKKPDFQQRVTTKPPIEATVPPSPLTATPAPITEGERTLVVNEPIQEAPVSQALPRYPRVAQEREIEGRVVLSITIMPDGSVRDVRIVSAQPRGYFEESAVRAVQTWRYRPSNVTRTNVIVHMDFELKGV